MVSSGLRDAGYVSQFGSLPGGCCPATATADHGDRLRKMTDDYLIYPVHIWCMVQEYINLDAGVWSPNRTASGDMQPDPTKFPSGIASLAAKLHAMKLKLGLFQPPSPLPFTMESLWPQFYASYLDHISYHGCAAIGQLHQSWHGSCDLWPTGSLRPLQGGCQDHGCVNSPTALSHA
jgi:hypothetical protein